MRKTRLLTGVATVVAAFGAMLLFVNAGGPFSASWRQTDAARHQQTGHALVHPIEIGSNGQGAVTNGVASRTQDAALGADPSSATAAGPFPSVPKTRDLLSIDDDPFGAQSKAEQQWLDRNGYPNMRQVEVYPKAPDVMLQEAADAGDRVARVMLEGRRLRRGDPRAEANLMTAAAEGSIYALNVLAGYYGQRGPQTNAAKAYSLTRVMEMLGDYKVPLTRQFVVSQPLEPVQQLQAEADALGMYRSLIARRKVATGSDNIVIQPRPI